MSHMMFQCFPTILQYIYIIYVPADFHKISQLHGWKKSSIHFHDFPITTFIYSGILLS